MPLKTSEKKSSFSVAEIYHGLKMVEVSLFATTSSNLLRDFFSRRFVEFRIPSGGLKRRNARISSIVDGFEVRQNGETKNRAASLKRVEFDIQDYGRSGRRKEFFPRFRGRLNFESSRRF